AASAPLHLVQRGENAHHKEHRPPAEVADEIDRRDRSLAASSSDRVQHSGHRKIVDIVTGPMRQRSVLSPPRYASVDKIGVARETLIGTDSQALRHPWAISLDQHIRVGDQLQKVRAPRWRTHIDEQAS